MHPLVGPLQIPGGPELLILFMIVLVPLSFVVAVTVGVFLLVRASTSNGDSDVGDRLDAVEDRLRDVEQRLEERD